MAIYTDFFVASETELRRAFAHRFPVADQPVERVVRNQFTGQTRKIKEWPPAEAFPKPPEGTMFPNKDEVEAVRRLPFVQWKGVDQVKLAKLQQLVAGGEYESMIDALCRPALLAPDDGNSSLFRLPQAWIEAVAGIEICHPRGAGVGRDRGVRD